MNRVGRPQKNNRKIGLSINIEAKQIMEELSEKYGRTKSNIVEEALFLMAKQSKINQKKSEIMSSLTDEDVIDLENTLIARHKLLSKKVLNDVNQNPDKTGSFDFDNIDNTSPKGDLEPFLKDLNSFYQDIS